MQTILGAGGSISIELAKSLKAHSISTDELEEQSNNRNRPCLMSFSSNSAENTLTPHERVKILIRAASLLQGDINSIFEKVKDKREHVVFEGVHLLPNMLPIILGCLAQKMLDSFL